ncbi:MAG: DNA repair protein RadA [Candidatus Omnitrophica bacterium]|nr:DNA repair protein RadA [Candidatus Omnitrophota bacterium]
MFICRNCGYKTFKWLGKCPECGAWESFTEEVSSRKEREDPLPSLTNIRELSTIKEERFPTQIKEFDRVLGGGLIKGEVVLVGGEPGIGKSTLLLEVASQIAKNKKVLYVSAEESLAQINLRAKRLGIDAENLFLVNEDNLETLLLLFEKDFFLIIIDSIQVLKIASLGASLGSLVQIRESANILTETAKKKGVSLFIVGHVTKEGVISGPKALEHIVDCVIYFEGEKNSNFRILRAVKNRFGSLGEIGVFEMTSSGLKEVENPSSIFISGEGRSSSGSAVGCVLEGVRAILVEVQALVTRASFGMVRRKSVGFDFNRFSLILAMMEKRLGLNLGNQDVFVNVTGGIRIDDPCSDLALVLAVASSYEDFLVPRECVFIGEVGLSGELRRVYNISQRLSEIKRLGFLYAFIPQSNLEKLNLKEFLGLKLYGCRDIKEVISKVKNLKGKN